MEEIERLFADVYDDGVVTEVIRPAAILPESAARAVLADLALQDVRAGGLWHAEPAMWRRYDRPCGQGEHIPPETALLGTIQVAYGTPTRYEITIYRATVTQLGTVHGWTVEKLCDQALQFAGLDLATCPRASLQPPPPPYRR